MEIATATNEKTDKALSTIAQYGPMIEDIKTKLDVVGQNLQDAFSKQNDAVKLYIDQRLGQNTSTGSSSSGGVDLGEQLRERFMGKDGIIDKVLNRVTSETGLLSPVTGSGGADPVSNEILSLQREFENGWKLAWRQNLRDNLSKLRINANLPALPGPETVSVNVSHAGATPSA